MFRSAGQHEGVVVVPQLLDGNVRANVRAGDELHTFGFHLRDASIDDVLLQLEVRDPVAQQPADAIGLLVDRNRVPGAPKLLGCRQTPPARSR